MTINPKFIEFMKDLAIGNFTELLKLTDNGVKAIKEMLEISGLNQKNDRINLDISKCYQEIGKEVYKNNSTINNPVIKESIQTINKYEKEIEENLLKIEKLKLKAKEEGATETDLKVVQDALVQFKNKNISVTIPSKKKNSKTKVAKKNNNKKNKPKTITKKKK